MNICTHDFIRQRNYHSEHSRQQHRQAQNAKEDLPTQTDIINGDYFKWNNTIRQMIIDRWDSERP